MQIAKRVYSLAQDQNDSALMIGAYRAFACTLYSPGDFETARQYAMRGVQIGARVRTFSGRRGHRARRHLSVLSGYAPVAFRRNTLFRATMAEAISLARELNDTQALAIALHFGTFLAQFERNPAEVERLASDLIELSTRQNFALWLAGGEVFRGWARSASGNTAEGISWIEDGIED